MSWNIEFYKTKEGNIPVEDFVDSVPVNHRAKILSMIKLLTEYGLLIKGPYAKHIVGTSLKELRIQASPNIYRILYFAYVNKTIVLLHGFTKKTEQIPRREIETAINRMNDYIRRNNE